MNDYEIVAFRADGFDISTLAGSDASFQVSKVEFQAEDVDKGAFPHYMLKEIFEQPNTVRDALRGRLSTEEATAKLGGLNMTNAELRQVERIVLSGCGTAFHAAMVGEYLIESLAHIPVECEFASELRYRNLPMTRDTLVFVISQSGETADTLAALRESQRKGHRTLGICNNVASTIARESDGGVYMHAGPEIGVAATKSFTSQLTIVTLLALLLGRIHYLSYAEGLDIISQIEKLPEKVRPTLFFSVPTLYNAMLAAERVGDSRPLRLCVSAAEPLPADVWTPVARHARPRDPRRRRLDRDAPHLLLEHPRGRCPGLEWQACARVRREARRRRRRPVSTGRGPATSTSGGRACSASTGTSPRRQRTASATVGSTPATAIGETTRAATGARDVPTTCSR